jgi:hypothetical protein
MFPAPSSALVPGLGQLDSSRHRDGHQDEVARQDDASPPSCLGDSGGTIVLTQGSPASRKAKLEADNFPPGIPGPEVEPETGPRLQGSSGSGG